MQINKEDFLAWINNPVTQEVHQVLRERQEHVAFQLAAGGCLDSMTLYAKAVGHYEEIRDLLEMTYEDMLPKEMTDV